MPSDSLAEFELLVMLAALRLGPDDAYTVSIVEEIEASTGRLARRANVFTTLQRLEKKGFITTRLGDPKPDRGGRPPRGRSRQSSISCWSAELAPLLYLLPNARPRSGGQGIQAPNG